MKTKHALILIALGYCFEFFGAFQKIMHTAYADFILMIAMILKVIGVVWLVFKLVTNPKAKDFMNW